VNRRVSDSLGETTTTGINGVAVIFGETAPDAVWLANGEGVGGALHHDGAGRADRLGGGLSRRAGGATLTFRVEEDAWILSPAGAFELPIPNVGIGPWKPGNVGHVLPP